MNPMPDRVEAGTGPVVGLVHSSVAGARQWHRLMHDLEDRFRLIAVNLYGYGRTPAWPGERAQTLQDQAELVLATLPEQGSVSLVGHSFGGAVAMKAAAALGPRVEKLILFEPNPFYLLKQQGRDEAFAEISRLRATIARAPASGDWVPAAERFADYWGGPGSWAVLSEERRATFVEFLKPNVFEWDAVMNETTALNAWAQRLPGGTVVISTAHTVRPIREITELLRQACPAWRYEHLADVGHMAPLTRADLVNPLLASLLLER